MRTTKELLIVLRNYLVNFCKNHEEDHFFGLCGLLYDMVIEEVITEGESDKVYEYLKTRYDNGQTYWWSMGDATSRHNALNDCIDIEERECSCIFPETLKTVNVLHLSTPTIFMCDHCKGFKK